jgi:DNA-binding response OmpR family regulator
VAEPAEAPRLLVIDDDESLRDIFTYAMTKEGFVVAAAEDGAAGLAKAAVFRPHLIVLDLMMPKLDGFGVLRGLQAGSLRDIPVIVITGYSDKANEALVGGEPSVVAFMVKPIAYDELARRIRSLLA